MVRIFILLYFFLSPLSILSQDSRIVFKNISIDNGLSQNSVVDIVQDSLGFMWFATQDGLNRYDGNEFKIFPKSFDDITSSTDSKLGRLYVYGHNLFMITKGGNLEVMDLTTEAISHIKDFESGEKIPFVTALLIEDSDKIWIGTEDSGLFLMDSERRLKRHLSKESAPHNRLSSNKINKIFRSDSGKLWVLGDNGITEVSETETSFQLPGVKTNTILEDFTGRTWLGTLGSGMYLKTRKLKDFVHLRRIGKDTQIPADLVVESLHMDKDNRLWIGTYGDGLFILEGKRYKLMQYLPDRKNPGAIGFQDVLKIFADNKDGVWIGTDGGGISFYHKSFEDFKLLSYHKAPEDIAVEQVRAITSDEEGFIWIGTSGNGFTRFDPKTEELSTYTLEPFNPSINNYNRIVALHADSAGDLWIGTHGNGTLIMDRKTGVFKKWFTTEAEGDKRLPDNTIWCFLKKNEDVVWAGSRHSGLLLIDKQKGLLERYCRSKSSQHNITAIARVNDSILALGHEKRGIKLFNTCTGKSREVAGQFVSKHLKRVEIKSLYYLNDWLWAGTAGKGIFVTNLKTGKSKIFSEEDGLPNNMIYGIVEENSRKVWVSSNKGLFRLTYKKEGEDLEIDKLNLFTQANGLQSNEFNTGAYHKAKDGKLYFGGIKGLNYFEPEELPVKRERTRVVISEAMVDNTPMDAEKLITYTKNLTLPYSRNSVALNYTALDYVFPERINYSYMLEGYDEDWISAGNRKYTAYTNLPSGDYTFKVKLADNIVDKGSITTLGISIATPYWQAWWFVLTVIMLILAILYGIYANRIHQLLELQKVKDSISADLHDDLGSRLTTVHLLSAISRIKFKNNPEMDKVLNDIDKEIYASSEALDEIVWNIRMTDEDLADIIAKIRRYVSEVLENQGLKYSIQTEDDFEPYQMRMQKRRELFLICKELINNVRKHSEATKVEMSITRDENMLRVSVKDDGCGFDPVEKTHRNGIVNIKKRVEKWNGRTMISSKKGAGTEVEIWIPFDKKSFLQKFFPSAYDK